MREILFRGKTDNKWVYGVPIYLRKEAYIVRDFCLGGGYTDDWVEAETIGQFTGLTDKNGKKIFEGDIVKAHFCTNGSKQTFIVIYNNGMFLFDNKSITVPKHEIYKVEVIGNIHDNKELLGE